ncbi:MAG TPA: hypothetical protein VF403_25055, partial [Kofleriaceae bacterium]
MKALLVVAALASVADADDKADPTAAAAADEANLESNAPRAGMTFSVAVGAGITMGDGVGRGPALSFRIGHVATPSTVLTLEITGGSLLHQEAAPMGNGPIMHNDFIGLMAGGLYYVSGSFWIRGASGLATYTIDSGMNNKAHLGITGVGGLGLDFVRWHYLVLGIETFSQVAIVGTRGLMLNTGLCLGLT